ncbi:tetratricopeptide repeat-containing glycosyltransferase family 2 protein [Kineococcus arenarius]|uniref:tetratricopeptide repeat-containing glycosyltransferase family 2 protein n=1 Tax=unclassified Kineococcus TaxID=2621656 RepID=UPI003D7D9C90
MTLAVDRPGPAARAAGRVSITAALIVKDEEQVLAEALQAVAPFVDEVVVYDTGSTDATREIARACGAVVVEGYWDDDFAAARNRGLGHVTSDWVLTIDADEVVSGDVETFRAYVDAFPGDAVCLRIASPTVRGGASGGDTVMSRLFRRAAGRWDGALHEHLVSADTGEVLQRSLECAPIAVLHSGYFSDVRESRGKAARNLRIARRTVEGLTAGGEDAARAWLHLGRCLVATGEVVEALDAFAQVVERSRKDLTLALAARAAVAAAIRAERPEEARAWTQVSRAAGEAPGLVHQMLAEVAAAEGDHLAAIRELAAARDGVDPWGSPYDARDARLSQAKLEATHGDPAVAVHLLHGVLASGYAGTPLATVIEVALSAGADLTGTAAIVDDAFVERSLRECFSIRPPYADAWLTALHVAGRSPARALVAGAALAQRLPLEGKLTWSLRLREAGLAEYCPLRRFADDEAGPRADRCIALFVLAQVLGEVDAAAAFEPLWSRLDETEQQGTAATLAAWIPAGA